jgi:hypothetical protein
MIPERAHTAEASTSYFDFGIEGPCGSRPGNEIADRYGLFACSDISRHNCPNLRKGELAIVLRDDDTGSDAFTP